MSRGGAIVVRLSGCLAHTPWSRPLEALAGGASGIVLRLDHCERMGEARENLAAPLALIEASNAAGRARIHPAPPVTPPVSVLPGTPPVAPLPGAPPPNTPTVRALPGTAAPAGTVLETTAMPFERARLFGRGTGQRYDLPALEDSDAARLVAAAQKLGCVRSEQTDSLAGRAWFFTTDGCGASGVCVNACPTGALKLNVQTPPQPPSPGGDGVHSHASEDGAESPTVVLSLTPSLCVGCGECVRLCPSQALRRRGRWSLSSVLDSRSVELETVATRRCSRCRTYYRGQHATLCDVCAYRAANPAGVGMPPGVVDKLPPEVAAKIRRLSKPNNTR